MSRSSYSDDCDGWELNLYRGNVWRSMRGKAGQARLRELRDSLLALPVKELQAETFAAGTKEAPKVCALGAWAVQRTGDPSAAAALVRDPDYDAETAQDLGKHGWPRLVVLETIYVNDEHRTVGHERCGPLDRHEAYRYYHQSWPAVYYEPETPAERYARVLGWVNEHIAGEGR